MLFLFILSLSTSLLGAETETQPLSPQEKSWQQWKTETFKEALESPTSFLNAYSLASVESGQNLYLIVDKNPKKTRWVKQEPKNFHIKVEHIGDRARIQVREKTLLYLQNSKGKRRKKIQLSNGIWTEIVYGKRVGKLWTYLYNPEQINSFTGFNFYPYNPTRITNAKLKVHTPQFVSYKTVQGDPTKVRKLGNVSFELEGKSFYLPAYNWQKKSEKIRYIALVFTDLSGDKETYAGGRELVIETPVGLQDGMNLKIDFNRSMNFYCAHSPFWHCPVGLQKKIDIDLKAGEKLPEKKIVSGI